MDQRAEPDVVEQIFRRIGAALSGLVNLRTPPPIPGTAVGIFHHHAPHQRYEQHAENAPTIISAVISSTRAPDRMIGHEPAQIGMREW